MKPKYGSGARGMQILKDNEQLIKAVNESKNHTEFFLQSYVLDSRQFKATAVCLEGRIISFAMLEKAEYFPKRGGSSIFCKPVYGKDTAQSIKSKILRVAELTRWTGVLDLDLIFDNSTGKLSILEINPRVPACYAHYFHNGNHLIFSLISGAPREKEKKDYSTFFIGLGLFSYIRDRNFKRFTQRIIEICTKAKKSYDFISFDILALVVGSFGHIIKLKQSVKSKLE